MENDQMTWEQIGRIKRNKEQVAEEMYTTLKSTCSWLAAALECKTWHWDGDQREAAEFELSAAREALAKADGQ